MVPGYISVWPVASCTLADMRAAICGISGLGIGAIA